MKCLKQKKSFFAETFFFLGFSNFFIKSLYEAENTICMKQKDRITSNMTIPPSSVNCLFLILQFFQIVSSAEIIKTSLCNAWLKISLISKLGFWVECHSTRWNKTYFQHSKDEYLVVPGFSVFVRICELLAIF